MFMLIAFLRLLNLHCFFVSVSARCFSKVPQFAPTHIQIKKKKKTHDSLKYLFQIKCQLF